jgi:hypothetical protein
MQQFQPVFKINRANILQHPRTYFVDDLIPIQEYLDDIETFINLCFVQQGYNPVQSGRVIALRCTDKNRLISAFKSAVYLGKYKNMDNVNRFLRNMVEAGHSYEPIRGESILFFYIGVGKPVYDHLTTYSVGRTTRIAGGQRANLPWGYEKAHELKEAKGADQLVEQDIEKIRHVIAISKGLHEEHDKQQLQALRNSLPVGFIMPPFLLEFSEEALIKNIFKQRIFEKGAQGATVDIVKDMWNCCIQLDKDKWMKLYDYHGPHVQGWMQAMRTMRDKDITIGDLLDMAIKTGHLPDCEEMNLTEIHVYDILMATVGKVPPSMWDKEDAQYGQPKQQLQ